MRYIDRTWPLYSILILALVGIVFLCYKIFLERYYILVIDKDPHSQFENFIENSKIKDIDKNYRTSKERIGGIINTRKAHPYCGFKAQPGIMIKTGDYTNGLGEKSPYLSIKKNGVIRIAMIGGSVVYQGSTNDKTIIGAMAHQLKQEGFKVEYINAGIVSGITDQELSVVVHDLLDLQVDLIISFDGWNDIINPLFINGRIGWPWKNPTRNVHDHEFQHYYPPVKPLIYHFNREILTAIIGHYLDNIHKISVIAKAFDIKYLAVIQPMRNFDAASCQVESQSSPVNEFYCRIISSFKELDHESKGAVYVSLADYLKNQQNLFSGDIHITDDGNDIIAQRLSTIIQSRGLLSQTKPHRFNNEVHHLRD
jgi:hypothetical protein